ncbi:undecaprenyl diphosphate synthase family protein, partial [Enterococcus faecalis]|uniref:undecaprenyl diphosphate synthase family protein n=1 Tax=Enterococcus faecalis TaxID=1351 RepID=UPI003CC6426D
LLTAMKQIAAEVSEKTYTAVEITVETIADHLMTGFLPTELRDPELLFRTSGEERISNFLLWQIAYSELCFKKTYLADFLR